MAYYLIKVAVTAILVVAISELARRYSGLAALIAALPLTSLLAMIWLHVEGSNSAQIAILAGQIFWLVLPSLVLFVVLPLLLRHGYGFWFSLVVASLGTSACYLALLPWLRRIGVQL